MKTFKISQNLDQVIEFKEILKMRLKVMKTERSTIGSKNSKTWCSHHKQKTVRISAYAVNAVKDAASVVAYELSYLKTSNACKRVNG